MQGVNWDRLLASPCSWEKNTGSRPANPIGDTRHSPYGDRLRKRLERAAWSSTNTILGKSGLCGVALWQALQCAAVRNCGGPAGVVVTCCSYDSAGMRVAHTSSKLTGDTWSKKLRKSCDGSESGWGKGAKFAAVGVGVGV